jgi:hypothetical protein
VLPIAVHGGQDNALPDQRPPEASLPLRCFIFAIVLEHVMFVLKYVLAEVVPDMPQSVRRDLARREFLKAELQSELDHRPHFRPAVVEKAIEAGRLFSYDTDSQYVDPDSGAGRIAGDNIIMPAELSYLIVEKVDYDQLTTKTKDEQRKNKKKERREVARQESIANQDQAASDMAAAVAASAGKTAAAGLYGNDDADAGEYDDDGNGDEAPPPPPQ